MAGAEPLQLFMDLKEVGYCLLDVDILGIQSWRKFYDMTDSVSKSRKLKLEHKL